MPREKSLTTAPKPVPYLVSLPIDLAQRLEEELHQVRLRELPLGRRGHTTTVGFFRKAVEALLDRCEAERLSA